MDKSPLGVHQVELVIESRPGFGDGRGVAQHAHCTLYLGQITTRNRGWWLVVNANLNGNLLLHASLQTIPPRFTTTDLKSQLMPMFEPNGKFKL